MASMAENDEWMARILQMEEVLGDEVLSQNQREAMNGALRSPASLQAHRALQWKIISGSQSKWPTLGLSRSHDPVMKSAFILHARFMALKWKQLTWQLRARQAFQEFEKQWKMPVRWPALTLRSEFASVWGELGVASQTLKGPDGPPLYE